MIQVYNIAVPNSSDSRKAETGLFIYLEKDLNEIVGFISKLLPDNCVEVTLLRPLDNFYYDGMEVVAESLTKEQFKEKVAAVELAHPGWLATLLSDNLPRENLVFKQTVNHEK